MEALQFANWFENVFVKATAKLKGSKLLIFDGHNSHLTILLIEMAIANNVELFCLPSHTSHVLQPLDVRVFKSAKTAWRSMLKRFYQNTGFKNVDKVGASKKLEDSGCFQGRMH